MTMFLVTKDGLLIGRCVGDDGTGWRFLPNTTSHKPSRKAWPSAVSCIPKWAFDLSDDLLTAEEWAALRNAGPMEGSAMSYDDRLSLKILREFPERAESVETTVRIGNKSITNTVRLRPAGRGDQRARNGFIEEVRAEIERDLVAAMRRSGLSG